MPLPTIKRLTIIDDVGVLRRLEGAQYPEFRRLNLIYGFNGCGKTTLSRLFASLERGTVASSLPAGGSFEFELTDGASLSTQGALDLLVGRVLVFNEDFVDANLRWKEGTSTALFFLGARQVSDAGLIEQKERKLSRVSSALAHATIKATRAGVASAEHKRTTARLISDQLGIGGRRYEAPNLTADYKNDTYDEAVVYPQNELEELRQIVAEGTVLPRIGYFTGPAFQLNSIMKRVRHVLQTTPGDIAIEELAAHSEMLTWAKQGLDYHKAHDIESCLFCGGQLRGERIRWLARTLDSEIERLLEECRKILEEVKDAQHTAIKISESFSSQNDLYVQLRGRYAGIVRALHDIITQGVRTLGQALPPLYEKVRNPTLKPKFALIDEDAAEHWSAQLRSAYNTLNGIVDEHNRRCDDFKAERDRAREKLKGHYLAMEREKFRFLERSSARAQRVVEAFADREAALVAEIANLRAQARLHAPAAAEVNKMLASYLGRQEIELVPTRDAFQICRSGRPLSGPLSEGERTAVALCYFLTSIRAEGRKTKDLIVILDDPISSLDTRALHYAFNIIKTMLGDTGQLLILTHNINFMNETKKWLKDKLRSFEQKGRAGVPPSALLFIHTTQDPSGVRISTLEEMPKLIRDYESEYHYLFSLILHLANSSADNLGDLYLMPNAMRKVMDIFFSFKVPGPHGLASKIDTISISTSVDSTVLRSIERLAQLESHADSLDDLVSLSSLTLEETIEAARSLMSFIKTVEPEHYKQMHSLCRTT